jgi:hypothetical protein
MKKCSDWDWNRSPNKCNKKSYVEANWFCLSMGRNIKKDVILSHRLFSLRSEFSNFRILCLLPTSGYLITLYHQDRSREVTSSIWMPLDPINVEQFQGSIITRKTIAVT